MAMSKSTKVLIGAGFAALIGFIIIAPTRLAKVDCQVCIEFHGKTSCKPAAGTTKDEAMKTATDIACSDLAIGRTESIACQATRPKSFSCK